MTAVTRMQNAVQKPVEPPIITIEDTYGHCCCCRELPCVKNIWSKYEWMGQMEVYGEMIQECFGITWPQSEERRYQICEVCIAQLRTALQFKRCIQKSHEALTVAVPTIKVECEELKPEESGPDAGAQDMITETYLTGDNPHVPLLETDNGPSSDTHQPELTYNDSPSVKSESKKEECVLSTDILHTTPIEQCQQNETESVKEQTVQKAMSENQKKAKEKSPTKRMSDELDGPCKLRKENEDKLEAEAAEAALYLESCDPYNFERDGISQPPSVQSNIIGDLPVQYDDTQNSFLMLPDETNTDSGVMCSNDEFDMTDVLDDEDLVPSLYASDNNNVTLMDTACSDVPNQVAFENTVTFGTLNSIQNSNVCPEETKPVSEVKTKETYRGKVENKLLEHNIIPKNYSVMKSPKGRPVDVCYYCRIFTFSLSRHITQNHEDEPEVQEALKYPKNSIQRRACLAVLRKKGNLFCKTLKTKDDFAYKFKSQTTDNVPCTSCSECGSTPREQPGDTTKPKKKDLLANVILNDELLNKVFTHINSDKMSLVVREDKLICMLGAQYYLTHQNEHNCLAVVSRKMKELANLLVEVANSNPDVVSLEQALKPQHYDIVVRAIKVVARYDETLKKFEIPHYSMNIVTSLKECCRIAVSEIEKMDVDVNTAKAKEDLNAFAILFEKYWKFIIADPGKNSKSHLVSIAADLQLLKSHLSGITTASVERLMVSKNKSVTAFNDLVEVAYCHVALLNRCEHNELQKLTLSDYNGIKDGNKCEQFKRLLSLTEKVLLKKLKMIVVRDERDRPVPVLFNTDVQKDIKLFLSVRRHYIPDGNNVLFKLAGGATLYGDKALLRYAKACGAQNFKILTSTNLQKYAATVSLLLSMSEAVLIKVVNFLGLNVQQDNYQSPSDVYQIAIVSRLLLLMEEGKIAQYHGKTLDEVHLDMDEELDKDKAGRKKVTNVHFVETLPECSDVKKKVTAVYFIETLQECSKLSEAGTNFNFMETLPECSNLSSEVSNVLSEETLPECSNLNQEVTDVQFVQPMPKCSNLNQVVTNVHFVQPVPQPSNLNQVVTNVHFVQPVPQPSNLNQEVGAIHIVSPMPECSNLSQEVSAVHFAPPMPECSNLSQEVANAHFVETLPLCSNLIQNMTDANFIEALPVCSNINEEVTEVNIVKPLPECSNLNMSDLSPSWESSHEIILDMAQW